MSFRFPDNKEAFVSTPWTNNGVKWIYNPERQRWARYDDLQRATFVQDAEPTGTKAGQFWYAPTAGTLYVYDGSVWQEAGGGASDVSELTTTGLTEGNMLRVKIAGGLEERTPDEVRGDIGAVGFGDVLPVLIKVKNLNSTLTKGTPVYVTGSVGDTDVATVAAARADDPAKVASAILSQTLTTNQQGTAHVIGQLTEVSTNALGTTGSVYLAPTGGLTRTRPTNASHFVQWLGTVERINVETGVLNVNVTGPHTPDETFAPKLYVSSEATNTAWGAIPAGTDLNGKSLQEIITQATIAYLEPSFSSFSITGTSTVAEVGSVLSSPAAFVWGSVNPSNFDTNSIQILNNASAVVLASGLANDGSETVELDSNATAPISYGTPKLFRIRATKKSPGTGTFFRDYGIEGIYPWFFGKSTTQPIAANIDIFNPSLSTKKVEKSNSTITAAFNSLTGEYIWFAIPPAPSGGVAKTKWFVDELNKGDIGGSSNLFSSAVPASKGSSTPAWAPILYQFYISNYPTAIGTVQLRNS